MISEFKQVWYGIFDLGFTATLQSIEIVQSVAYKC